MSHSSCPRCGKFRQEHFDDRRHFDHHHFDRHHHDFDRHHCKDFICDRFICDDDFRLRLGGLQGGLNFRLRQLIGCLVRLELEEGKKIEAKICFVGSDFIEVEVFDDVKMEKKANNKHEEMNEKQQRKRNKRNKVRKNMKCNKALIIPFEAIKFVELKDDCC